MRHLLLVLTLVALGMALARLNPPEDILPAEFSESFPEHRTHHELLLHNLGQRPLRQEPGDAVRLWWVSPNPQRLLLVNPEGITVVTYETAGYKPRVTSQKTFTRALREREWQPLRELLAAPELWSMPVDPGRGPFSLGARTWILEVKLGSRYRCLEKIDPKPELFTRLCDTLVALAGQD